MRTGIALTLLALSGCTATGGNQSNGNAPANRSGGNSAATEPAQSAAAESPIVGRWGDNGDCSRPVQFFGNGTYLTGDGTRGHWRIDGDQLTVVAGPRRVTARLVSITPERVVVVDANGQRGESVRCA